ncbi:MAG: hypothetical protein WBD40_09165 [Tepidisphaeraceae bacterium]
MGKFTPPPEAIQLADVPKYVRWKTGEGVTRMTVYNWCNKGVNGVKLKTDVGRMTPQGPLFQKFTTREWLDQFLAQAN